MGEQSVREGLGREAAVAVPPCPVAQPPHRLRHQLQLQCVALMRVQDGKVRVKGFLLLGLSTIRRLVQPDKGLARQLEDEGVEIVGDAIACEEDNVICARANRAESTAGGVENT